MSNPLELFFTDFKTEVVEQVRNVVRAELQNKREQETMDKLLSPSEACLVFNPKISKVTLNTWTNNGLLPVQRIGGRVWYRYSDLIEAGSRLKKYKRLQ